MAILCGLLGAGSFLSRVALFLLNYNLFSNGCEDWRNEDVLELSHVPGAGFKLPPEEAIVGPGGMGVSGDGRTGG
jgi:hypothetical protein